MLTTILIDILNRSGGRLGITPSGNLVMAGITEPLASEVRRHHADHTLALHLSSITTGNVGGARWRMCTVCPKEAFTTSEHKCTLTPDCKGRLTIPERIGSPPHHEGTTCARAGCGRPGWGSTHWGQVYCLACWHTLTLLDLVEATD